MSEMRKACDDHWRAAQRRANLTGILNTNPAAEAGRLIEEANGDVAVALIRSAGYVTTSIAPEYWQWVTTRLSQIIHEEEVAAGAAE